MQRNAAVLTVFCILLCLTINYTFPLHRETSQSPVSYSENNTNYQCDNPAHRQNIVDRSLKMAGIMGNALKRFKDSTTDLEKNIYDHVNNCLRISDEKNHLSEEDLRHYEQLVIMKKYPYLDFHELELRYGPSSKNTRQNIKYEAGSNFVNDPAEICEPLEDGPNVEITNRGLSGFAIPPQLSRRVDMVDDKLKNENTFSSSHEKSDQKISKKSSEENVLVSLMDDVREYVEKKVIKLV